ncbi:MAG: hypothetical protein KJ061_00830 [Vicinamibacteraceae bacterium]|nr:hypothetical protein [Vicinamibacteraceae bacterium]
MTSAELLVVSALAATLLAMAMPRADEAASTLGGELAARRVAAEFEAARRHAESSGRRTAVVFDPPPLTGWALVEDGDDDGVTQADIASGTDVVVRPRQVVGTDHDGLDLAVRFDAVKPESFDPLPAGSDPVQVGPSRILHFSPEGTGTSGTVYIGSDSGLWAVRVFGSTGRTRLLGFRSRPRTWELR